MRQVIVSSCVVRLHTDTHTHTLLIMLQLLVSAVPLQAADPGLTLPSLFSWPRVWAEVFEQVLGSRSKVVLLCAVKIFVFHKDSE